MGPQAPCRWRRSWSPAAVTPPLSSKRKRWRRRRRRSPHFPTSSQGGGRGCPRNAGRSPTAPPRTPPPARPGNASITSRSSATLASVRHTPGAPLCLLLSTHLRPFSLFLLLLLLLLFLPLLLYLCTSVCSFYLQLPLSICLSCCVPWMSVRIHSSV
ncbi:hypothetical protein E2C01_069544 [Portunus trituberculatus]|uniref:Uncharacterized protein n=1 Tax=Portunus trituberculatus TaxID=210409 RepID=A0A5B7HRU0_PORTR|nr:hypothetical protein [Portunus trituberculatus]